MDNKSRQFSGFDAIQPALNEMGQMARDSNDESKNPWAGVRYGNSNALDFEKVYRGVSTDGEEKNANRSNIGIHWSLTPEIAAEFATKTNPYNLGEPAGQKGKVFSGLVHQKDIWDYDEPGALEHFDRHEIYHPESEEMNDEYAAMEDEATIKNSSPIKITSVATYTQKPGAGNVTNEGYKYRKENYTVEDSSPTKKIERA